jgi:hypothetical protein
MTLDGIRCCGSILEEANWEAHAVIIEDIDSRIAPEGVSELLSDLAIDIRERAEGCIIITGEVSVFEITALSYILHLH